MSAHIIPPLLRTRLEKLVIRALCLGDQPDWFTASFLRICDWSTCWPAFRCWLLPPLLALWFSHLHLFVSDFFLVSQPLSELIWAA